MAPLWISSSTDDNDIKVSTACLSASLMMDSLSREAYIEKRNRCQQRSINHAITRFHSMVT